MQVICRARLKLGHKVKVERPGLLGFGVDQQAPATDVVGEHDQAGKDILEEPCAEPVALVVDVDGKPGQKGDRLRVAPAPFA